MTGWGHPSRLALGGAVLLLVLGATAPGCGGEPDPSAGPGPFQFPEVDLSTLPDSPRRQAEEAERLARADPDDAEAVGLLGLHYMEYDLPLAAATCLERASQLAPDRLEWPYSLSLAYEKAGDLPGTLRALEAALEVDDEYAPLLLRLADAVLGTDPARAKSLYGKALALQPENARAHFGLGRWAQQAGDRKEAIRHFGEAARIAPGWADVHYALAMNLSAEGRREEAAEHLRRHAQGGGPPSADDPLEAEMSGKVSVPYLLMQRHIEQLTRAGRLDEVMDLLLTSSETDVSGTTARKQMAEVLGLKGRYREAEQLYREVLDDDPADYEARTNLGRILEALDDGGGAEREYRAVLQQHPEYAPALVFLGRILCKSGRRKDGIRLMERGIEVRPAEGPYRYFLGVELAADGRVGEAAGQVRKAGALMPNHAGVRFTLGQLLMATGDPAGAREAWLEAVQIAPGLAEAWIRLALLALEERDPGRALEWADRGCRGSKYENRQHLEILARAHEAAGQQENAVEIRRRAAALP